MIILLMGEKQAQRAAARGGQREAEPLPRNFSPEASRLRQLSQAIEQSPASILITDREGSIEYVNPAFMRITGYTLDEVFGKKPSILKSGHSRAEDYKQLWETVSSGRSWRGEFLNKKKNGELFWESACISPVVDEEGKITHFVAVKEDITQRKQAEQTLRELSRTLEQRVAERAAQLEKQSEALRASEERFRLLLESAPDAMVIHDQKGNIALINAQAERLFGCTRSELVGQPVEVLIPERFRTAHVQHRAAYSSHPQARLMGAGRQLVGRRKDGSEFPAEVSLSPIESNDGVLIASAIRDITARLEIERALVQARDEMELRVVERTAELATTNERLIAEIAEHEKAEMALQSQTTLLDMASDAILVWNLNGGIVYWNQGAERLYGFSRVKAVGQLGHELLSTQHPQGLDAILTHLVREGEWTGELSHVTKNGCRLFVESRMKLLDQPNGRRLVVEINRDLTERLKLQGEIVAASERERDRLGRDLHDSLCQILTGIRLKCESLADYLAVHSSKQAPRARALVNLIEEALEESRKLAQGLQPVSEDREGLKAALQQLAETTRRHFGVVCSCEISAPDLVPDHAVASELFRIAQEAVNNAVRHAHASSIALKLIKETEGVVLTVTNDGKPFPKRPRNGMGLKTMQFRAGHIGATLTIRAGSEGGTIVRCSLTHHPPSESNQPAPPTEAHQTILSNLWSDNSGPARKIGGKP
jgi:PAS domain S-box-containing protein